MLIYIVVSVSEDGFGSIKKIYKAFKHKDNALLYIEELKKQYIYDWYTLKEMKLDDYYN